ncbi:hypothetical protein IG631_02095 [Alternaria alternata]|nr:hypothetical protein IG631_02095 [Alternaria alternata]
MQGKVSPGRCLVRGSKVSRWWCLLREGGEGAGMEAKCASTGAVQLEGDGAQAGRG